MRKWSRCPVAACGAARQAGSEAPLLPQHALDEEVHHLLGARNLALRRAPGKELEREAFERGDERGVEERVVLLAGLGADRVVEEPPELGAEALSRRENR